MSRRPETSVGAVVIRDGAMLMIRRGRGVAQGQWSVPGGRVEFGETLQEAVVREVAEETGLEVVCGAYVGHVERIGVDHHYVILDYLADPVADQPLVAGDDAAEAAWIALGDLSDLDLVDGMLEFLADHGIVTVIT